MPTRLLKTYYVPGLGTMLDVPAGCWVSGSAVLDFGGYNVIGPSIMQNIRRAAGETYAIGGQYSGVYTINSLPNSDRYGKFWHISSTNGRAIFSYVDTDSSLNVCVCNGLKSLFKPMTGVSLWQFPQTIVLGAQDCMGCLHASHYRAQVWWNDDKTNPKLGGQKFLVGSGGQAYSTSASGGTAYDWTPLTYSPVKTYTSTSYQPVQQGMTEGAGTTFGAGPDGRTWSAGAYGCVCTDDGVGDAWGDGSPPVASTQLPGNSFGGSPYNARSAPLAGKSHDVVAAGAQSQSNIVETADGSMYQLLWTTQYSRMVQVTQPPRPYDPERGADNQDTSPLPNSFVNDPNPTSGSQAILYSVPVPADSNKIQSVRFNWVSRVLERAPILGVLNDKAKPTKLTFNVPAWPEIPAYKQNPGGNPYSGVTYITTAYTACDFTFNSPSGFYYHIGKKYDSKASNAQYATDPPPSVYLPKQASGNTPGYSFLVEGRGEFGVQPKPLPYLETTSQLQLPFSRAIDVDKARGSSISFDIETFGDPGQTQWKNCYLIVNSLAPIHYTYRVNIQSRMPGTVAPPIGLGAYGSVSTLTDKEFAAVTSYVPGVVAGTFLPNLALDEINQAQGTDWKFSLNYTPGQYANGLPQRLYAAFLDQYAQFQYVTAQPDFYMIRSRDRGATWEFCANSKPISQLSAMRDFNNAYTDGLMPAILADENNVYLVWAFGAGSTSGGPAETHPVKTLGSQDCCETWTLGKSFAPEPAR